jgi:hypothetical protein
MAVTAKLYSHFGESVAKKLIDLSSDDIKAMLTTSSYIPDQDTHDAKDDVSNEITGTNYDAGGKALANKAVTISGKVTKFDADDTTWASSTITARYAVLYDNTPAADEDKKLIGYVDFDADKSSENGNFTLAWNAGGIATLTVA